MVLRASLYRSRPGTFRGVDRKPLLQLTPIVWTSTERDYSHLFQPEVITGEFRLRRGQGEIVDSLLVGRNGAELNPVNGGYLSHIGYMGHISFSLDIVDHRGLKSN
jgi:hypothetical protein